MEKEKQTRMRGGVLSGIVLLLIIALLVGACAKAPAPATPAPGTPAATPTPAPTPVKPITIKFASSAPKTDQTALTLIDLWWIEELKKRTGGRVQFEEYWGGALATGYDSLFQLGAGNIGMTTIAPSFFESFMPWDTPTNSIFGVMKTPEDAIKIERTLVNEFPVFQNMWLAQNTRWLWPKALTEYFIMTRPAFTKLEDLKGQKLYSWGSYVPKVLAAAGMVPVSIATTDVYDAVKTGLITGRFTQLDTSMATRLYEVAKNILEGDFGAIYITPMVVNLDLYNSFPADIRKIVDETALESTPKFMEILNSSAARIKDFYLKEQGVTVRRLSDAEIKKVRADTGDILQIWVDQMQKQGGQGVVAKRVADRIRELAAPSWK